MSQDLSYPIGKFKSPDVIDQKQVNEWIEEIAILPRQMEEAIQGLSDAQLDTPYRPNGWTVRQVIHHVPDSHISSYMRFHWAMTEENPLIKAYDEKSWALLDYHKALSPKTSLELLQALHARWVVLMKNMNSNDLDRTFVHPEDGKTYFLREVIGMYAWHGKHHLAHIQSLKSRMNW